MNWEIISEYSNFEVRWHWATATLAFILGPIIFLRAKGTRVHKTLGAIYATLMITTAVSAFFIRRGEVSGWDYLSFDGMTFIHLFIPLTLFGIFGGLYGILIKKDPKAHKPPLFWSYIGGVVIAGALTLIPGRRMQMLFFGEPEQITTVIELLPK